MGRDHQPKYRQLERKQGCRAPYDRILIVCEGSKTEPNYFREIRITHRLPTANIIVLPSKLGTAPRQVVECAKEIFESGSQGKIRLGKTISPRSFEQVFAVFDRDDHESYFDALDMAASLDGKLKNDEKPPKPVSFQAVPSDPCFELWLLLHFEDIQAPLHRDEVMRRLRVHLPKYEKGAKQIFAQTFKHLNTALQRARTLENRFEANTKEQGPHAAAKEQGLRAAVFKLVDLLANLRKE